MTSTIKKIKYSIRSFIDYDETYFVSFQKSGRTWVRMFLSHYFFNCYPFSLTSRKRKYFDNKIPNIIFSHGANEIFNTESSELSYKKESDRISKIPTVLLIRDPRDVMISYYFHITKRNITEKSTKNNFINRSLNSGIEKISDMIDHDTYGIKNIIKFSNIWYESCVKKESSIFFYEDIKMNPQTEFSRLLSFLGESKINEKAFHKAIQETDFETMKMKEKANISNSKYLNAIDLKDNDTYKSRKGKVNGFLDYLDENQVNRLNIHMQNLVPELRKKYLGN